MVLVGDAVVENTDNTNDVTTATQFGWAGRVGVIIDDTVVAALATLLGGHSKL